MKQILKKIKQIPVFFGLDYKVIFVVIKYVLETKQKVRFLCCLYYVYGNQTL